MMFLHRQCQPREWLFGTSHDAVEYLICQIYWTCDARNGDLEYSQWNQITATVNHAIFIHRHAWSTVQRVHTDPKYRLFYI